MNGNNSMINTEALTMGFLKLSTPTVSDALDKLEIHGGCEGLKPVVSGKKIVGPAFTVRFGPRGTARTKAGDFIDDVQEGEVVVIDNCGRTYCTVWGDILTLVAKRRNLGGTVIDGVCRDVDGIRAQDYPIFTKGYFMVTGKDRVECKSVGETVSICNVSVKKGDIIMADDNGVLVIPIERAEDVLKTAMQIEQAEQGILREVEQGSSLQSARQKFKYDSLQRPQSK